MPLGSEVGRSVEGTGTTWKGRRSRQASVQVQLRQGGLCLCVNPGTALFKSTSFVCCVLLNLSLWLEGFNYYLWCPWNREGAYFSLGGTASLQELALCHREHLGGKPRPGCPHPFWLRTCSKTDTHNFSAHYQPNDTVVLSLGMRRNRLFLGN